MNKEHLNRHWVRKLLKGQPHMVIGSEENPYLMRWFLVPRNRFLNIYLHKFCRSDDDRALHDHPWHFLSIILRGGYWEHRGDKVFSSQSFRKCGSVAFRHARTLHRVELEVNRAGTPKPAWTIVVTGPVIREWGFVCPGGWRSWETFMERGCD